MVSYHGQRHVTQASAAIGAPSHAVTIDRSSCTAPRHGTASAYVRYRCRCDDAREDWRLYKKRRREGRQPPLRINSLGAARRIRALCAIGWPQVALAEQLGWSKDRVWHVTIQSYPTVYASTAARIKALYDRLQGTPGPSDRTRKYANAQGWATPLAWDDIDDPNAMPVDAPDDPAAEVDLTVVELASVGLLDKPTAKLPRAERELVIQQMTAAGRPAHEIAARVGVTKRTVERARSAMKPKEAAA